MSPCHCWSLNKIFHCQTIVSKELQWSNCTKIICIDSSPWIGIGYHKQIATNFYDRNEILKFVTSNWQLFVELPCNSWWRISIKAFLRKKFMRKNLNTFVCRLDFKIRILHLEISPNAANFCELSLNKKNLFAHFMAFYGNM